MSYHGDAYFCGGYIYYSCYDRNSKKDVLYRMKPDGSKQERLVTLRQKSTGGNGITLVYGNSIYFNWWEFANDGPEFASDQNFKYMCRYNVNDRSQKYYKPYITEFTGGKYGGNHLMQYEHYKQYFVTASEGGDYCEIPKYVLNANTGKLVLIDKYAGHARMRGKTVYYIRKYHNHFYLYSCNLQGKKQKKLAEFKGDNALPAIISINQKYCKIVAYNYGKKYSKYQYFFATGKLKKIK